MPNTSSNLTEGRAEKRTMTTRPTTRASTLRSHVSPTPPILPVAARSPSTSSLLPPAPTPILEAPGRPPSLRPTAISTSQSPSLPSMLTPTPPPQAMSLSPPPSPSPPTTTTLINIMIISPPSDLPNIDPEDLAILREKQRRLRLQQIATFSAPPTQIAYQNALSATLIFAQHEAGTAVCISSSGLLLTCAHCFGDNAEEYAETEKKKWLLFHNGAAVLSECISWDPKRDLALLQIIAVESTYPISFFPFLKIAPSPPKPKIHIFCIGQPGSEDLESSSARVKKTKYNLIEVSEGRYLGMVKGNDPQDNEEIGGLMHDAWTYWGHSGAPLVGRKEGMLVGLHSSWDDETGTRHGVGVEALWGFLGGCEAWREVGGEELEG